MSMRSLAVLLGTEGSPMDASKSALPFQGDAPLPFQDHHRVLGVGARQVTADINHFLPKERLEQAAMQDERLRLARELHDGVLRTLTGALLQLEALSRLMEADPEGCPQTVAWPRGADRGGATRATRLDPAE